MRRAQIWSKKAKRELERLEKEIAAEQKEARSQSEGRQEEIKVLWDLDDRQLKAAKNPAERKDIEQKLKGQKLKKLLNSVGKLADDDKITDRILELRVELKELGEDDKFFNRIFDRIRELVDLVGLQDRESAVGLTFNGSESGEGHSRLGSSRCIVVVTQ